MVLGKYILPALRVIVTRPNRLFISIWVFNRGRENGEDIETMNPADEIDIQETRVAYADQLGIIVTIFRLAGILFGRMFVVTRGRDRHENSPCAAEYTS